MKKFIRLGEKNIDSNRITAEDIIDFMESEHPEDKQKFAQMVFAESPVYNHFRAKNIFFGMYFPEVLEKKNNVIVSEQIRAWLNMDKIEPGSTIKNNSIGE